jgi:hypothetical protein
MGMKWERSKQDTNSRDEVSMDYSETDKDIKQNLGISQYVKAET